MIFIANNTREIEKNNVPLIVKMEELSNQDKNIKLVSSNN